MGENLIVADRCVSVEREVLGLVREMGCCMGMGQVAGVASVFALDNDMVYKNVDMSCGKLKEDGYIISPNL